MPHSPLSKLDPLLPSHPKCPKGHELQISLLIPTSVRHAQQCKPRGRRSAKFGHSESIQSISTYPLCLPFIRVSVALKNTLGLLYQPTDRSRTRVLSVDFASVLPEGHGVAPRQCPSKIRILQPREWYSFLVRFHLHQTRFFSC